jgi:hypothetical protein
VLVLGEWGPTGVTLDGGSVTITGGVGELVMRSRSSTRADLYAMRLEMDGVGAVFTLTVSPPPAGQAPGDDAGGGGGGCAGWVVPTLVLLPLFRILRAGHFGGRRNG